MQKKYIIIIAAALVLAAGIITAVLLTGRDAEKEEEFEFLPAGMQTDIDELKDVQLTFYLNAQKQNVSDEILEAVNRKLKDELKTTIKFEFLWQYNPQFIDRIRRDNASGLTCDAFFFTPDYSTPVKPLIDEGLVKDVSELFPEYAFNYYNQFTKDDIKAMNVDGGIYTIPSRMPSADMNYAIVRQDLMEKYKIPEIHSYDDYEAYLEAVKENEPGLLPMRYGDTTLGLFANMYGYVTLDYTMGLVYKWDDPSMKIMEWTQTPVFKECLDRIARWRDKGYLDPENPFVSLSFNTTGDDASNEYDRFIIEGKTASFIANPTELPRFNLLLRSKGISDYSFKAYPLYDGYSARNPITDSGIMINSTSSKAERVLMFIDWLQSDQENYDLLMYGKKGTHYIDRGDYIEPPKNVAASFLEWTWKKPFENIDYQRNSYPGLDKEIKEYNEIIKIQTKYAPHYGFIPDYSTVQKIYDNMWMRYTLPENIIYSNKSIDEAKLEKILEEQKESGLDSMITEIQGQLDEYVAKFPK